MFGIDRRRFFAALLAPLVVPWQPLDCFWWGKATPWPTRWINRAELQRRMNALYNQRVDYMTLSNP